MEPGIHTNFSFLTYLLMVMVQTLWNCGFFAITREGKILNFITRFLEREKEEAVAVTEGAMRIYEKEIRERLVLLLNPKETRILNTQDDVDIYEADRMEIVANYLSEKKLFSYDPIAEVIKNLESGARNHEIDNQFYFTRMEYVFPSWVRDPVVSCITCVASFHSLLVYTGVVIAMGWFWNPFEWVLLAISTAFSGEFLWKLKKKIET